MSLEPTSVHLDADLAWISGGGATGALIRSRNWDQHVLGPLRRWPQSLRTAVSICLSSRFPMILWCGPQFSVLYNDAYAPTLGVKHPQSLGQPGSQAWHEIWDVIHPMLEHVCREGEATWSEDQLLFLERSGYSEETYHTFSYSPIRIEDGSVGGVFTAVTETTLRVINDRRLRTLREVATRTARTHTIDEACEAAAAALSDCAQDVPFAAIYLKHPTDSQRLVLKCVLRLPPDCAAAPIELHVETALWPVATAINNAVAVNVSDLTPFGALPGGEWPESPSHAVVQPIMASEGDQTTGVLILGVNCRRKFDDSYAGFFELLAGQVSTAIARARAYEEERRRAELLAELDRAKTIFFSNVSHEFRTPLTLMLGPIEDLLGSFDPHVSKAQHDQIKLLHRNALRLVTLVNTLLDFSRLEAGRIEATFIPTDLGTMTADLVSTFRSAINRAGMELVVDCPKLAEPVYLDRDMWEKIVLNLMSNAFKYTLSGRINVRLRSRAQGIELAVSDSGVGIPAAELPKLFERFHRVHGAHGRTHEGTGIGLAMVLELVKLHGGTVHADSVVGQGSTFYVQLPHGSAHLPQDRLATPQALQSTSTSSDAFLAEALRWLPDVAPEPVTEPGAPLPPGTATAGRDNDNDRHTPVGAGELIVLADDNADMRDYVGRLLTPLYQVISAVNGHEALALVRQHRPALVISDIMMPGLDGFGLLRELRADPVISTTQVILLSARAGEEARIEGLQAGADDYLVKPFSARELLARIRSLMDMTRLRHEVEIEREQMLEDVRAAVRHRDEFLGIASHELRTPLTSLRLQMDLTKRAISRAGGLRQVPEERIIKMMSTFEHQVTNLTLLIDDLLDVSRIGNGRLTIEPQRVDLGQLVEQVLAQNREQLDSADCKVSVNLRKGVEGFWDPKRLEQVVVNLLSNAAKYAAGQAVYLDVASVDHAARLLVRDGGMGISAQNQEKIFERFERAVGPTNISGLGLGLYIVKEIVCAHQGTIEVNSALGEGSEFVVTLPRAS